MRFASNHAEHTTTCSKGSHTQGIQSTMTALRTLSTAAVSRGCSRLIQELSSGVLVRSFFLNDDDRDKS